MKWISSIALILAAAPLWAADPPAGKKVFDRYCSECHAPGFGHPGTQELELTRGKSLAILEQRKDLAAEYVRYVVRHGLWEMPPYRPAEIDDARLSELVQYLVAQKADSKKP
jgi:mono/diheme cytochrome c family protein